MYSYTYDTRTGGLLLNFSPTGFSREPRPVYAPELDVLGFDKYWRYERQSETPYMWAEANQYYYRGVLVAKLKGGNAFSAPEIVIPTGEDGSPVMPEPDGSPLRPIDIAAMSAANTEIINVVEQATVKRILRVFNRHKKRLDSFHVAFSGGKDSCVLLDLVKKALPKGSFVVVFGDTGMEFPDTYEVVRKTQEQCKDEGIPFYIAKSHLDPEDSWRLFGPPSRVLRWCCSVHKSSPQTLKLREITGKADYSGLAFVGVRGHESSARANYEYENYGRKIKGQYDSYPLLEWTSAEIFIYTYINNIFINESYKKGSARAGCLVCPMTGGINEYIRNAIYSQYTETYYNIIRTSSNKNFSDGDFYNFINTGAWKYRADGRFMIENNIKYIENIEDGKLIISTNKQSNNWREWIKTVGLNIQIDTLAKNDETIYTIDLQKQEINPSIIKLLRQTFRKTVYCIDCSACEANCRNGCISFNNRKINIEECKHCHECHSISGGCLIYDSLKLPRRGVAMRSINSFTEHAPKSEWISDFFINNDSFLLSNTLGPDQILKFKVFLTDSFLIKDNNITDFAKLIIELGWNSPNSLGLILINLVNNNPQMEWYVKNFDIDCIYAKQTVIDMLINDGLKERPSASVVKAFKRIVETPFGTTLHFGHVTENDELSRTKCAIEDFRVVLYGLFKFAEKCNNYKEFTLTTLLNDSIERDGISPTRIFGLTREEMKPMLLGLTAQYPAFIYASFTHDLEKISLAEDKTSQDVLSLFLENTP